MAEAAPVLRKVLEKPVPDQLAPLVTTIHETRRISARQNGNRTGNRPRQVAPAELENDLDPIAHRATKIHGANQRETTPDRRSGNPSKSHRRGIALGEPENGPDRMALAKNIRDANQRKRIPDQPKEKTIKARRQQVVPAAKNPLIKRVQDPSVLRGMIFGSANRPRQTLEAAAILKNALIAEMMTRTKGAHHPKELPPTVRAIRKPDLKKNLFKVTRAVDPARGQKPLKQKPPFKRRKCDLIAT